MKIKSIYIDGLHNAVNKTYQLNDLVYLYGRNGAGKTTILNAIQLALLGYIPGTAKNSREALLRHAKTGHITVRLDLDNDGESVTIERSYDSKSSALTVTPEGFDIKSTISDLELPIFNFSEFIDQTSNKLKDYFIKNILPTSDGDIDWEQILKNGMADVSVEDPAETLSYGLDLISEVAGSPIEQVAQANAKFKEEQSFVKGELARLQATIDSLVYYDDYSGPRDISALDSKLLSLGAIRDALIRYQSAESMASQQHIELDRLKERIDDLGDLSHLEQLHDEYSAQRNQVHAEVIESETILTKLRDEERKLEKVIKGDGVCPYTGNTCEQINLDDFQNQYDFISTKLCVRNNELNQLKAKQDAIAGKLSEADANISSYHSILDRIKSLETSLSALPEKPNTDMTLSGLDAEIQRYTADRDKLKANLAYEATIENITKLKYKSELNNSVLAAWVKLTDINGLQTTLAEQPFAELAATMTKYIQTMYGNDSLQAKFNISAKSNSFSFGLVRDDKYIAYDQLSSGEKCLYTLALMICIIDSSKSPLKLMLCDDMFDHLDSQAVEGTFTALKAVNNIQFILAGVKDCKNAEDVMVKLS